MTARDVMRTGAVAGAMIAAALFPGPVFAQARTEATVLMSEKEQGRAVQERYGFADAVVAGDMIYLSGIVAGGGGDATAAYERLFDHAEAILKRAGASLSDIVDMTSYHTDLPAQIDTLSAVSKLRLGSPPPAWTAIDVDRLLPDGGITEIKFTAYRPRAASR